MPGDKFFFWIYLYIFENDFLFQKEILELYYLRGVVAYFNHLAYSLAYECYNCI